MKEYILKVTKQQARIIASALDLYSRIGIGQWREITNILPLVDKINYTEYHQDLDLIGTLLSQYLKHNVDGYSSSLGIGHQDVHESSKIAYESRKVIEKYLSWEQAIKDGVVENMNSPRKWPEMLGVNYDDPLKLTEEEFLEIEQIKNGEVP